jgi:hypothetical protein
MNLPLLAKRDDPARGALPAAGHDELLDALRSASPDPSPTRRHRRRAAAIAVAGIGLAAGGGGLAYALVAGQPPATALKVNCAAGIDRSQLDANGDFTSVLNAITGDPVADCAAAYEQIDGSAPELRAYESGKQFVWVVPADWPVPATWHALPPTFRNDPSRLALKQRLEDRVDGPSSRCVSTTRAEALVDGYLDELALDGWSVQAAPGHGRADGTTSCAFASVAEGGERTLLLYAGPPFPPHGTSREERAYVALVADLRSTISDKCLTLDQALAAAQTAASRSGTGAKTITADPSRARCATVDLADGGGTAPRIVVRGSAR